MSRWLRNFLKQITRADGIESKQTLRYDGRGRLVPAQAPATSKRQRP